MSMLPLPAFNAMLDVDEDESILLPLLDRMDTSAAALDDPATTADATGYTQEPESASSAVAASRGRPGSAARIL